MLIGKSCKKYESFCKAGGEGRWTFILFPNEDDYEKQELAKNWV